MQPHCDADLASVAAEAAPQSIDIVVTPVVNQELIAYPLVRICYQESLLSDNDGAAEHR